MRAPAEARPGKPQVRGAWECCGSSHAGSWDAPSGVGREVLLPKVDAEGFLSLNSTVTGTARNIPAAAGTPLAPLLGDETGDAGTPLGSYRV